MSAGPVDLTVTFLSPVEPDDFLKQSLGFSYYSLSAVSTDNNPHSVKVYTDISAEWVSGNDSQVVNWNTTTGNVITHQVQLENQTVFADISNRIQQGSMFHSTLVSSNTTYQTGQDIVVRAQFINHSVLTNSQDTNFRSISDDWPVFALAHDLGEVTGSSTEPVVFSIGHVRDPAIEYITANGVLQSRSSYFWSQYSSVDDVISDFLDDYSNATTRANAFDTQVNSDASKISANYSGLVQLSVRQAFGAIESTISKDSAGEYDTSDIMAFIKEISSSGRNCGGIVRH